MSKNDFIRSNPILFRIIACIIILFAGFSGMKILASFKKPPAEIKKESRTLEVEVKKVHPETVPVTISGYGEANALDEVAIASEVGGRLIFVNPKVEPGGIIKAGEELFTIDKRNYTAAHQEAVATVEQIENTIARLQKQYVTDEQRLLVLERNRQLAHDDFLRFKKLFEDDQVVTRSSLDAKEQAYNNTADQANKLAQTVSLYPLQIAESQKGLEAARAKLSIAQTNLERTTVKAPFTGRVKEAGIEEGQYVSPGQALLTLANDAVLEILVSLDSRDAKRWLQFADNSSQTAQNAWFADLEPVTCDIYWTEDRSNSWHGKLHRVVRFDQETRTVTVAIRINAVDAQPGRPGTLPLVEGMFCEVQIPGRTITGVYTLPRWAVSFQNTVYLAVDNRLKTADVHVALNHGDDVLIDQGLSEGDLVIITRLVNPLENSLLSIQKTSEEAQK